jgi:glycosyltransferase involved in cell wall biosynthesis
LKSGLGWERIRSYEAKVKISIVTVVYENPMVGEALDSILSQRLDPEDELELVVIDGGSRDGTREVLERYRDRIAVLVSEPDGGIYDAMNKGLRRVTGDIVGTLNSDDLYMDDAVLATVAEAFRKDGTQLVYGDLVYVRRSAPDQVVRYWKSEAYRAGLFERGWMPPHPTFFVRREAYLEHGLFDLNYRLGADFELTLRFLAKARLSFSYIPKILVRMRVGGATNNSLRNILKANLECQHACRKNGLDVPWWFIPRKVFPKLLQFFKTAPRL